MFSLSDAERARRAEMRAAVERAMLVVLRYDQFRVEVGPSTHRGVPRELVVRVPPAHVDAAQRFVAEYKEIDGVPVRVNTL